MKKIIATLAVLALTGCTQAAVSQEIADSCTTNWGTWLPEHNECEGVGEDWCTENGGEFYECESACRNNPEAEICTMQCVLVCKF